VARQSSSVIWAQRIIVFLAILLAGNLGKTNGHPTDQIDWLLYDGGAVWSPDGDYIAFESGRAGSIDIWIMEPDGTNLVNLTFDSPEYDGGIAWSPDGKLIAFESERAGTYDIWLMDMDGGQLTNLTPEMSSAEGQPRWSPDGRYLVFTSNSGGTWGIWIMQVGDSSEKQKMSPPDAHTYTRPSWLSDSRSVVFLGGGTPAAIWKANISDTPPVPIVGAASSHVPANPEVCAENDLIAFTDLSESVLGEIWIADSNGRHLQNLTSGNGGSRPAWSPDCEAILFHSTRSGELDIWKMRLDGSQPVNLSQSFSETVVSPAWSPDGAQIVFSLTRSGDSDIWLIDADGSNPRNLTSYRE